MTAADKDMGHLHLSDQQLARAEALLAARGVLMSTSFMSTSAPAYEAVVDVAEYVLTGTTYQDRSVDAEIDTDTDTDKIEGI